MVEMDLLDEHTVAWVAVFWKRRYLTPLEACDHIYTSILDMI
jgi:hypothetical protein